MQGQAQDFGGNWVATNDLNLSERYLAAVRKRTPEQLRDVARKYLTPQNRTLYALLPTGSTLQHAEAAEMIVDSPIQKIDFPNGLRLLVKEDHRLPFVEIRSVFKGGVLAESASNNGLTLLLSKLLLKGTKLRSAEQIANEIESLGGSIDTYGGNNSFGVNSETLSVDFLQGLELVADVILNPSFPETALAREKEVQLASVRAQKDHMLQSASRSMRRALFGQRGYGLDVNGSEETVTAATVQDLRAFYAKVVVPNNCVIAIFGDINVATVRAAVERVFGSWRKGPDVLTEVAPSRKSSELTRVAEIRDKKQGVIIIAFPGISIHERDRFALELLQEALSDLGSRLFVRIRENLGLAYYVGAQHFVGLQPGYFAFYAGTTPEKLDQVEQEMFIEVAALRAEGLTPEELKRAKAKLLGQKKIARQDLGGYAVATALDELYGLGYGNCDVEDSQYEAVTLDDIRKAAEKYFRKDSCVVAMVRPSELGGAE
jgi:zinc protease